MSMSVDWEYFFPEVIFTHEKCDEKWQPTTDLKNHLEELRVPDKFFNSDNLSVFPPGFSKPIYSVERFEEARIELKERIQIEPVMVGSGQNFAEFYDDEGEFERAYPKWKLSLKSLNQSFTLPNAKTFHISRELNRTYVHRFNLINLLFDWLLMVYPNGTYKNAWQIFAYGITEYDETMSSSDMFTQEENGNPDSKYWVQSQTLQPSQPNEHDFTSPSLEPSFSDANAIRHILKIWNPAL